MRIMYIMLNYVNMARSFAGNLWLDQIFAWREIWLDIVDRPFITVGMLALILLLPLAISSNQSMTRRLGRNWKRLHRLAYVIKVACTPG